MPPNKRRYRHHKAVATLDKRLITAIRGRLVATNPKLTNVPSSLLTEAVIRIFPKAFLDVCSAQMKSTPMIINGSSEGKWIFQVPSMGLFGGRTITDCFRDLANLVEKLQCDSTDDGRMKVPLKEATASLHELGGNRNANTIHTLPSNQFLNTCEAHPQVSSLLLKLLRGRLVRLHGERTMKSSSPAAFVIAVYASFPRSFLDYCDARLAGNDPRMKRNAEGNASSPNSWAASIFDDPPSESLGGKSVAACFRQLAEELTKRIGPESVPKKRNIERDLEHEKRIDGFSRELKKHSPSELRKMRIAPQPEWKQRAIDRQLVEVKKFLTSLDGKGLAALRTLALSFDVAWKNEEVENRIDAEERRKQQRLELEKQQEQERAAVQYVESLRRKTLEDLEDLEKLPLEEWRKHEVKKRLTEVRLLERARESELLITTLRGNVVRTLCDMVISHSQGWQSDLICEQVMGILHKLGLEFMDSMAKESGEGLQRVVALAKEDLLKAIEAAVSTQLLNRTSEDLSRIVQTVAHEREDEEILRYLEKQLPSVDPKVLKHISTTPFPSLQFLIKVAKGELIRRRHQDERVTPRKIETWVP